jgi:hypothetical protein
MPTVDITPPLPICTKLVLPPFPALGLGLSLDIPLPGVVIDIKLCCKVFQLPLQLPPIQLGIGIDLSAVSDLLNDRITEINKYLDRIPVICPREATVVQFPF